MKSPTTTILTFSALLAFAMSATIATGDDETRNQAESPFVVRAFEPVAGTYQGNGISYGPYRDGQRPGNKEPTTEQIAEDLKLLAGDQWQMIRTYGTEPFAEKMCKIIRDEKLPIKVMLGAWVETESSDEKKQNNSDQVDRAIKLANAYPNVIAAVCVGNESQVFWSFHKVKRTVLINYIRSVRAKIKQPVTVADDFKYWKSDDSKAVASEIDFIVAHMYAMWLGQTLENSVPWTKQTYADVSKQHPNRTVVLGETGWATEKADHGDQGKMIKGKAGEQEQKKFFESVTTWLKKEKIGYFYFEAFDEAWKGGDDPAEVEKHWGLFRQNRTRKPAIKK